MAHMKYSFMSTLQKQRRIPARYGAVLVTVLLASLAYAVLTAHILLWVWGVAAVISLGLSVFGVYLFYRLVLAVERIAYEQ
jgi:hypothetical protein